MPPHRCLASWISTHVLPRGYLLQLVGWPLSWGGKVLPRSRVYPWQGSCRGLVSALGKSLAGALRVSSVRRLAGASWASSARSLAVVLSSGPHPGFVGSLSSQRSACLHAGASRALVPTLSMVSELSGSRVTAMLALGELPPARLLPGLCRPPWQGSCQGKAHLV